MLGGGLDGGLGAGRGVRGHTEEDRGGGPAHTARAAPVLGVRGLRPTSEDKSGWRGCISEVGVVGKRSSAVWFLAHQQMPALQDKVQIR